MVQGEGAWVRVKLCVCISLTPITRRYNIREFIISEKNPDVLMGGKPESTEGVGRVSVLKRQEGAPLNLG